MVRPEKDSGRIRVIHLAPMGPHADAPVFAGSEDVLVPGFAELFTLNWAGDGKGWYVSNRTVRSTGAFLYIDLKGKATILNAPESFMPSWGIPSPDGRRLAFSSAPGIANVWMVENF